MKIVIAPDSFKESLSALEVAEAVEKGFRSVLPDAEYVKLPMADGGEGTVQSLVDATQGEIIWQTVTGPIGQPVEAFFGILGDGKTAVIEMAAASGLHLVPAERRDPLVTTSRGTGELLLAALDHGAEQIIMGLGGSATNDGGAGMADALGVLLLDENGARIGEGGGALSDLASIDLSGMESRIQNCRIEVACDVENPLTGEMGASAIFGPQKGADAEKIAMLDRNLMHYAEVIHRDLHKDIDNVPGAGAAGGLGGGLLAFTSCELKRGIDIVIEAAGLADIVRDADLVITGEGRIDGQTIFGKTPVGVAKTAKRFHVPVIALAGNVAPDSRAVHAHGIDALFSIVPGPVSLEEAMEQAEDFVERTAANVAALWNMR
ncbi:glycerate kinase [Sporosarcina sp.]|uniref:glycerate kinase n=1 Tax=Sporosarcina sp. TaxID=49982 RepID=UPI00262497EB|nr:glycerate kinase [Sporosarcina sp.]